MIKRLFVLFAVLTGYAVSCGDGSDSVGSGVAADVSDAATEAAETAPAETDAGTAAPETAAPETAAPETAAPAETP